MFDSPTNSPLLSGAESGTEVPEAAIQVSSEPGQTLADFVAYMPNHTYINRVTGAHWPAASIDGRFAPVVSAEGVQMAPSKWLDKNHPVDQQVWDPAQPTIVSDSVMIAGAYVPKQGVSIFNRYRPPLIVGGDPAQAGPWLDHLHKLYPQDAGHIECYLASKLQKPGVKINHALVLGGSPGIGKDTLLEPVKYGVGPGNWQEISPAQMMARFNGWAKTVMLRISEAYHQGQKEAQSFYELSKPLFAGPPDVIRVDEKNVPEYYVSNVCGVVITTNNRNDALYLPADDRRHYVAWSEVDRDQFSDGYWDGLYKWLENGGKQHVVWNALIEGKPPGTVVVKSSPVAVDIYKRLGFSMSGATIYGNPLKTLSFHKTS